MECEGLSVEGFKIVHLEREVQEHKDLLFNKGL